MHDSRYSAGFGWFRLGNEKRHTVIDVFGMDGRKLESRMHSDQTLRQQLFVTILNPLKKELG